MRSNSVSWRHRASNSPDCPPVVGPSTLLMTSFTRKSLTRAVTLPLSENGIRRIFWITSITWGVDVKLQLVILQLANSIEHAWKSSLGIFCKSIPTVLQFSATGVGTALTRKTPRSTTVEYPNRHRPCLTTINCADTFAPFTDSSDLTCRTTSSSWPS